MIKIVILGFHIGAQKTPPRSLLLAVAVSPSRRSGHRLELPIPTSRLQLTWHTAGLHILFLLNGMGSGLHRPAHDSTILQYTFPFVFIFIFLLMIVFCNYTYLCVHTILTLFMSISRSILGIRL